jgi:hypothetical protein
MNTETQIYTKTLLWTLCEIIKTRGSIWNFQPNQTKNKEIRAKTQNHIILNNP